MHFYECKTFIVFLTQPNKTHWVGFLSCHHCPLAVVWKREVCRIFPYHFCLAKALMWYLWIQDATNMQQDFVFLCCRNQKLCFAKIFNFWGLEFQCGRLKLNYFSSTKCCQVTYFQNETGCCPKDNFSLIYLLVFTFFNEKIL